MKKRVVFPSTRDNERWPGAWRFGVDFSEGSHHVMAVHFGGADIKYGINFIGPVLLNDESAELLEIWADDIREIYGGYVHLLPSDGEKTEELRKLRKELEGEE